MTVLLRPFVADIEGTLTGDNGQTAVALVLLSKQNFERLLFCLAQVGQITVHTS